MNKINFRNARKILNKMYLFYFLAIILFSFSLWHQKMPLNLSMTFNSPVYLNADEVKIYNNAKTSLIYNNAKTSYKNSYCKSYKNSYNKIIQNEINKTSNNYKTLPISILLIVLGCGIPVIVLVIVLFVPSKKITDSFIAYDLNKKNKKQKVKLGIQKQKKSSYFDIDDDNL